MNKQNEKSRGERNRTIILSEDEKRHYQKVALRLSHPVTPQEIENKTINQDLFETLKWLPASFVDLLFVDPPYNLTKTFNTTTFKERSITAYAEWIESWFPTLIRTLKPEASVYFCGDWRSSAAIQAVVDKYLIIQNRITWEREKGRGAKTNWKNCAEDIWFCTTSEKYTFDVHAVKIKRRVIAPYTDEEGNPKDWEVTENGKFRLTHPSNIWTDLTVPFWSMPENTNHPTQKPEKLLARILLASSKPGDLILDPFLGSGTTSVVAKKLGRRFVGIEIDPIYCATAEKRLAIAEVNKTIQGFAEGMFWERNSLSDQKSQSKDQGATNSLPLFNSLIETPSQ